MQEEKYKVKVCLDSGRETQTSWMLEHGECTTREVLEQVENEWLPDEIDGKMVTLWDQDKFVKIDGKWFELSAV